MIKRKIENTPLKEKDTVTTFILGEGDLRAVLCHGTLMVNQMRANHQLQIAETLILGQNYIAASLLSANLKNEDVLKIKVNCTGPMGGLNVEADFQHRIRGYLINNPFIAASPESMSISDYFGAGVLSLTKTNRLTNRPFTGQIDIQYGSPARDLAYYYTASEQIATSFSLNVTFGKNGSVKGAGGLLVQALPGAGEETLAKVENIVKGLPSLGEWFAGGKTSRDFINDYFSSLNPKILSEKDTEFYCDCSKERIAVHISALSEEDKKDIIQKDDFPIKTYCHNCGTSYEFSREESLDLFRK
jgi:molecular chaperone Hsp33